jgi:hypothetical protein
VYLYEKDGTVSAVGILIRGGDPYIPRAGLRGAGEILRRRVGAALAGQVAPDGRDRFAALTGSR